MKLPCIKMILNRNDDVPSLASAKSSLQEEIEKNAKKHLSLYDSIIGTSNVEGRVAV